MDITLEGRTAWRHRQIKTRRGLGQGAGAAIHEGPDYFFAMLEAGADGYVPKRAASEDLIQAIRVVAGGEVYLHHSVAGVLVQDFLNGEAQPVESPNPVNLARLTDRERVSCSIAEGLRNQDIAEQLAISQDRLRHRGKHPAQAQPPHAGELIRYAIKNGPDRMKAAG
jgi:DNA-binding NarL/FixJ family response regulator